MPLQIVKSYKVLRSFVGTVCIGCRLCFCMMKMMAMEMKDMGAKSNHLTLGFLSTGITGQYQFLMERLQLLQFFMQVSAMCS